jgi:hypothetical protein
VLRRNPLPCACHAGQLHTTRKKPICGIQISAIGGLPLYATGKMPLVQAYPWHTRCTPWPSYPPMAYRHVRNDYDPYPWRTSLYARGVFCIRGVQACTPRVCLLAMAYSPIRHRYVCHRTLSLYAKEHLVCMPRLCFFEKKL